MLFGPIAGNKPGPLDSSSRVLMNVCVMSITGTWWRSRHATRQPAVTSNARRSTSHHNRAIKTSAVYGTARVPAIAGNPARRERKGPRLAPGPLELNGPRLDVVVQHELPRV